MDIVAVQLSALYIEHGREIYAVIKRKLREAAIFLPSDDSRSESLKCTWCPKLTHEKTTLKQRAINRDS